MSLVTELNETESTEGDEGMYYLVSLDPPCSQIIFQHSTSRCGALGPHFSRTTYTEIHIGCVIDFPAHRPFRALPRGPGVVEPLGSPPPAG